jgi:nanoRNase/pAp phosphatase (c-di-AMP/oligoRNAs hydrolase)/sortase (surface protein transpeptidase)
MALDNRENLLEFIKKISRPLIVIPANSSGDAISGALALFWAFKNNNKNPYLACSKKIPRRFLFLAGCDFIEQNISDNFIYEISLELGRQEMEKARFIKSKHNLNFCFRSKNCEIKKESLKFESRSFKYDSIFSIGSPNLKSLGLIYSNSPNIFSNLPIVNIDNHDSNENFGKINLTDSACASVSEIIARIIEESPDMEIDSKIATLLLTGIIERTENFQTPSIDSELFHLTAYLLALGARRGEIIKYLYKTNAFSKQGLFYGKIRNLLASWIKTLHSIYGLKSFNRLTPKQVLTIFLIVIISGTILINAAKINQVLIKNALSFSNYNTNLINSILNIKLNLEKNRLDAKTFQEDNIITSGYKRTETDILAASSVSNNTMRVSSENLGIGTSLEISDSQEISLPKKLEIPKLKVSANIENVGLTADNNMDIPKNDWNVGWFNLGPKPGETGSAVIAGHLDGQTGKPAIFWNLNQLQNGDYIFIIGDDGSKRRFRVIGLEQYDTKNAPLEKIFGAQDGAYLNLITCDGIWDKQEHNYDKRLVVFTKYDPE